MELPEISSCSLPPDFAAHERCWLVWPGNEARWDGQLDQVQSVCAEVAAAIAEFEPVTLLAGPESLADASIRCGANVAALPLSHDDPWLRDCGFAFAVAPDGALRGVVDALGQGSEARDGSALVTKLLDHLGLSGCAAPAGLITQRALTHDGEGTAIASERALLDPARNGGLSRQEIEAALASCLGIEKVIWLLQGLTGKDGEAAIDNLACFAAPGVVLALSSDDSEDENRPYLEDNLACLKAAVDAKERPLKVIEVPQPPRREAADGVRLPVSYLNLYIANQGVVVPAYEEATDVAALQAISSAFPEREVVQVSLRELVAFGGGIHRMTLQQPKLAGEA